MRIDDELVFNAELQGLRQLAALPRPKVPIIGEDVPGALCLWEGDSGGDVRLVPHSGVPLAEVVGAAGGHEPFQIRGIASSFDDSALSLLGTLDAQRIDGLHTMMALDLSTFVNTSEITATVARDAQGLAQLRSVVRQVYLGFDSTAEADDEADFFHAPGVMTYLATFENGRAVSTGSILVVDKVANIWSVATLPTARGHGAASAVVRAECAEARRQGATVAVLRTSKELARIGGLYNSIGFSVVGYEQVWRVG